MTPKSYAIREPFNISKPLSKKLKYLILNNVQNNWAAAAANLLFEFKI